MRDLNALKIFCDVARAGGFAAAHRRTGQSRATLSRTVAALEEELGTRLIERSTRSFRLTEAGALLFARGTDIFGQIDEAVAMVEDRLREPRGLVQLAVPPSLIQLGVGETILAYMEAYPRVQVQMHVSNREVDLRHEPFDFALRARNVLDYPLDFVPVPLAKVPTHLVVHPRWQPEIGATLAETLTRVPVVAWRGHGGRSQWHLPNGAGVIQDFALSPRLIVDDITLLRDAVLGGMGMAVIPETAIRQDLKTGGLMVLELDVRPQLSLLHAVHLGARGMRPAVRHLLDWLKVRSRDWV